MKIAVLYGGISKEREVSISSSEGIIQALKQNGHEVEPIDFNPNQMEELLHLEVDLVFIGLHGKFGEDGCVQGMLEMLNIPYVGSGVLASSLAMDKYKAKQMFEQVSIPTAKGKKYRLEQTADIEHITEQIKQTFSLPFVVKPNQEGSTLGLTIVEDYQDTFAAVQNASHSDDMILVEEFIKGKELTVPVMGNYMEEEALPIIEIIPKNEMYDYESKYSEGGSEHVIPARISTDMTRKIQEYAVWAHQVLGCEVYSRADFLLTEDGTPYILEVNTLPGMTATSLFPDAAKEAGISYEEMIEKFVQLTV
ncbi:MAG TPA: D-alanine--D-alanine ligase [Pseudogracilibacillus sp.]|nr:D-alanine--D-alanine ligase [Pseudogracilibacillus sp.]